MKLLKLKIGSHRPEPGGWDGCFSPPFWFFIFTFHFSYEKIKLLALMICTNYDIFISCICKYTINPRTSEYLKGVDILLVGLSSYK